MLKGNDLRSAIRDVSELPAITVELRHHFATSKMELGRSSERDVREVYGYDHALALVEDSMADYGG